jgi:ankyrin repeat protein
MQHGVIIFLYFDPGYYEIAELLLSRGAYVDPQWESRSPLYIAANYGNARIVELLLHHGAQVIVFFLTSSNFLFLPIHDIHVYYAIHSQTYDAV